MNSKLDDTGQFMHNAINKMFELAGHDLTVDDVIDDNWKGDEPYFEQYTITRYQFQLWKEWFILNAKIVFNDTPHNLILETFDNFSMNYCLKIVDNEFELIQKLD